MLKGNSRSSKESLNASIEANLASIYEEVMWLANRPNTTPSDARAWYTHIASSSLRKHIRRFSGMVSKRAVSADDVPLRLEHFKRMQTTLTQLVDRHLKTGACDAEEFVRVVLDCEQVHIVTVGENYSAMKAKGDYQSAGIKLIEWTTIPPDRQRFLWNKMLHGKVMNANDYKPQALSLS